MDIGLPTLNGIESARKLRALGISTPILFLTARDTLPDKEAAYHAGADDYLIKPFSLKELLLRIQALDRRYRGLSTNIVEYAGLQLDVTMEAFSVQGRTLKLNNLQYRLLRLLIEQAPRLVSRSTIVESLWGDAAPSDDALRVLVYEVRKALKTQTEFCAIHTEFGRGYALRRSENDVGV